MSEKKMQVTIRSFRKHKGGKKNIIHMGGKKKKSKSAIDKNMWGKKKPLYILELYTLNPEFIVSLHNGKKKKKKKQVGSLLHCFPVLCFSLSHTYRSGSDSLLVPSTVLCRTCGNDHLQDRQKDRDCKCAFLSFL